ncbi:phenylalanine--tRNA ligase subunit alpha, partial [Candidatus Roizmanbacteria bacterium]|nr:phenylalanine--tRNA ligase subunit alpha [Candidatus Roizmanbacteria bacterium]
MKDTLKQIETEARQAILKTQLLSQLESKKVEYLGRKGIINQLLQKLPKIPQREKVGFGKEVNQLKVTITNLLSFQEQTLKQQTLEQQKHEFFDVTLPTKPLNGHLHLVTYAIREITAIFERIGFIRVSYPEVDYDWYAFESLNMPKNHAARDEWETFFVDMPTDKKLGEIVLTPHTSNGQVREMERLGKPPIRMINIGKCYRRQSDVSHSPMFHQFEGLVVDKGISIPDLKGTLDYFAREYFGPTRRTRIRPFHFQFTEPSFEVDVSCDLCDGHGCRMCKAGWLEIGGAGMVHPNVLKAGNIDPEKYTGFAFGWGVERVLLMKQGIKIPDLRMLYSSDVR